MGSFEAAELNFKGAPSNKTAAAFLKALMYAETFDLIEDDRFFNGLYDLRAYLKATSS